MLFEILPVSSLWRITIQISLLIYSSSLQMCGLLESSFSLQILILYYHLFLLMFKLSHIFNKLNFNLYKTNGLNESINTLKQNNLVIILE